MELGGGMDEGTATERLVLEKLLQTIEHRQDRRSRLQPCLGFEHAFGGALPTHLQGGHDQFVLRAKVLVQRHLRHPGFGQDAVDAGGVVTLAIEQVDGGAEQLLAFAGCHGKPPERPIMRDPAAPLNRSASLPGRIPTEKGERAP